MAEVAFTSVRRAIASEFEYHESLFKVRILKPFGERAASSNGRCPSQPRL